MHRSLLLWLALCAPCWAVHVPPSAVPYTLVRVTLDAGERCFVLGPELAAVDVAKTADGLVFTGAPGRYVLLAFTAESQTQLSVTIGEAPTPVPPVPPVPPPGPRPDGYAGQVYDQAKAIGRPTDALKLAKTFGDAAAGIKNALDFQSALTPIDRGKIGQPRYFTGVQAWQAVSTANKALGLDSAAWGPFGSSSFDELAKHTGSLKEMWMYYDATAKGLAAAGGK